MSTPITYEQYLDQFDAAREYPQISEALHLFAHFLIPGDDEATDAGACLKDNCRVVDDVHEFIATIWDAL